MTDLAINQIATAPMAPAEYLKEILKAFLSLKTPIDGFKGSRLTHDIAIQLKNMQTSPMDTGSMNEEKIMVQILLHMQEHHLPSRIEVLELIQEHNIGHKVLEVDMRVQLEDTTLDSASKKVYRLLQDFTNLDATELTLALKAMIGEKLPVHQWGRLLRSLEVANFQNRQIYNCMDALLSDSEVITTEFARMSRTLYPAGTPIGLQVLTLIARRGE